MSEPLPKPVDDRRERILCAAERSFIASGFHGARMTQIAKEAQMSPGHIYHYFESKEQIIAEMIRSHFDDKLAMLENYKDGGGRVLDLMIENLGDSVDSNTDPFWSTLMLEIAAEATRNEEIANSLRNMNAKMRAKVIGLLRQDLDESDLEARLEVFVAIVQGIGIRNIINPNLDKVAVARIVREIVEQLFRRNG